LQITSPVVSEGLQISTHVYCLLFLTVSLFFVCYPSESGMSLWVHIRRPELGIPDFFFPSSCLYQLYNYMYYQNNQSQKCDITIIISFELTLVYLKIKLSYSFVFLCFLGCICMQIGFEKQKLQ
jgi:DMSO/TMAO reductase YedYZ heme-binding membrane subunit